MTRDLAQRIRNQTSEPKTFSQWAEALKTKNLTRTHINRALLHTILRITKADMDAFRRDGLIPYARLLGFRTEAAPFLTRLKERSSIPIITKVADAGKILKGQALRMFEKDIEAARLYRQLVYHRYRTILADEYRAGLVKI